MEHSSSYLHPLSTLWPACRSWLTTNLVLRLSLTASDTDLDWSAHLTAWYVMRDTPSKRSSLPDHSSQDGVITDENGISVKLPLPATTRTVNNRTYFFAVLPENADITALLHSPGNWTECRYYSCPTRNAGQVRQVAHLLEESLTAEITPVLTPGD